MSDHGSDNDSHYGQNDNMGDLNDMSINVIYTTGAIQIPHTTGRFVFHITGTMIQLLQMKGFLWCLAHEGTHEQLRNFKEGLHVNCNDPRAPPSRYMRIRPFGGLIQALTFIHRIDHKNL
uniref:Uncharacterized protein n=1 Tax=Solanum tuberosum TaxID=4113 RepID=M1DYK4_SOLTU